MSNADKRDRLPRVAVCLSGAPRIGKSTLEILFGQLCSYGQCDIFASVWHSSRYDDINLQKTLLSLTCDRIKVAVVEFPEEFKPSVLHEYVKAPPTKVDNVFRMYLGIQRCNSLAQEYAAAYGIEYDYIVRARTDVVINKVFNFDEYADTLANHLVMPDNGWGDYGINDQFAVAKPHLMTIYADLFNYLDYYTTLPEPGIFMHPETLLGVHLQRNNVPIERAAFQSVLVRDLI